MSVTLEQVLVSIADLRTEMANENRAMVERIVTLEKNTSERIATLEKNTVERLAANSERLAALESKISERDKEMVKWMVGVFIGSVVLFSIIVNFIIKSPL